MEGHESTSRAGKGIVFAWRRWQVCLALLFIMTCMSMGDANLKSGAGGEDGPFRGIAEDRHSAPVWSLAFAGSTRLASSTTTGEVRLKDLATGQVLCLQEGPGSFALSLAFSRGGGMLAVTGDGAAVRFWDAQTGIEQEPLRPGTGAIRSVAFSPGGARLAVGSWKTDRQRAVVTLWDWPARRLLARLEGHRGSINGLAFSPDGATLVTADSAGAVRIWDVGSGEVRACRRAHEAGIMVLAFSPVEGLFATASYVDGVVRLWDAAGGEPRGSLKVSTGVAALAFSPDGKTLAMARGDGIASLSDVASGREIGAVRVPTGALQAVGFSGDGRTLATGGVDGSVRLWDVHKLSDGDPQP